ncbi:MAG: DUF2277 domain-containing protein [Kangiellaceae bacterium]|nr:DUF2277 domain-containing protein [Kangiellaceae bacterium]
MCRNIKKLNNFEPPVTTNEVREASLQFVRKVSGSTKPSKVNQAAFEQAIAEISDSLTILLGALVTTSPPRNRETEAAKAKARSVKRFGSGAQPA